MHAVVSLRELLTRKSHLANSCTPRKTSQNMGWGLPGNPLDTLSQQQVGDRWGSQGGRRHQNSFHDLHFLWASSKNRQKRRKKRQIGKKESMGLTKGWCWLLMLNSQPGSKPTSSAVKHSFPGLQCCATKLITTRRWQHRCHHDHQIDDHHHDHHRVTVILLGIIAGIKIINLYLHSLYSMHSTHSVYLHFVLDEQHSRTAHKKGINMRSTKCQSSQIACIKYT